MSHLHAKAGSSSRVRLTTDGAAFLTNYARTVNSYPHKPEKEGILATLRTIPGNEAFTLQKLSSWFARHRNPSGDPLTPVLLDDDTILFPKLTPTHLQQLRVLYKKRADPSEGIITFWAERIKVEREEVAAWIQYQQEKAKENGIGTHPESPDIPLRQLVSESANVSPTASAFPRPHLPTPANSLSPTISPQTRLPSAPPIAVKEEPRQSLSPVSSFTSPSLSAPRPANSMRATESRSALEGLPPLFRHLHQEVR
ncbi:hypothetical protein HD554DRAFT_2095683 [Boletus coccyginus]|nr:hypothetical protein HD554DRAFT_2095683 [Boletus coccyginus]